MSQEANSETKLLSRRETAERLGISERQLDRWISAGAIRVVPFGKRVRIHREEVERIEREGVSLTPAA